MKIYKLNGIVGLVAYMCSDSGITYLFTFEYEVN